MKVVALVSGGKDSCYGMMNCIQYGHEIVALANLMPADDSVDELDSYMYQTVGHQIIVSYAECMGLPLFRRRIRGSTRHHKLDYKITAGDEVEDMFILLNEVTRQIPSITAVSSGAIASDYQRLRVESVCSRLGLVSLAYLWKQDQSCLLQEMISNGIIAITVKIAAMGLNPAKHLGKEISFLNPYLHKLKELYGINVCGEGGEYETLTLDCPLFNNARIVLDDYEVVMHSPDSIAPVAVLHPLAFHLETKVRTQTSKSGNSIQEIHAENRGSIFEVQGDCLGNAESKCKPATDIADVDHCSTDCILHISRTKNNDTFSLCCWLQEFSCGLREDLRTVLRKIEYLLEGDGFGWENVLYVHLYIDDMDKFSIANETYVQSITQEKCPFGVPSRSTVELPLSQVGLGSAYVEVLVTKHQSKRVLHVQSISSWAPSCIGPYSQATLHKSVLYMAGQLGLDPPTMTLYSGGVSIELEQALKNCEAVAKCFSCSISTSALVLVFYCSSCAGLKEMMTIHEKQSSTLDQMRLQVGEQGISKSLNPVLLYVHVPELPKKALVEVKPILYVEDYSEAANGPLEHIYSSKASHHWGFEHAEWHDSCMQKCIVAGEICAVLLSCSSEVATKICPDTPYTQNNSDQTSIVKSNFERISKFCVYLLDKVLKENSFSWEDTVNLRFYVPTRLQMPLETLTIMFNSAFSELAELTDKTTKQEPIFNVIPVLSAGGSSISMDDIITCEVLAQKF